MKNFIAPISIRTNSISDEKICIGLFVGSENGNYFSYSANKLKWIKKLLSSDVVVPLEALFENLKKQVQSNELDQKLFTSDYFL